MLYLGHNFIPICPMQKISIRKVRFRYLTTAWFILSFLLLVGCRRQTGGAYDPKLTQIDEIAREQPDSALAKLKRLDVSDFHRQKDRAKFALLSTRVRHNTNMFYSDSLMFFAEKYFMKYGSDKEKAQILYCIGNSFSSRDSFASASDYYSKAVVFAQNSGDLFQVAAIHNAIGYSCRFQMDHEEALAHFTEAGRLLKQMGWIKQSLIPAYQQIGMLNRLGRNDEAEEVIREANTIALQVADTGTILRLASMEATIGAERKPEPEKAVAINRRLAETYRTYNSGVVPESHYNIVGLIYFHQNKLDSARYYLTRSLHRPLPLNTRLGVYFIMSRLAELENRMSEALHFERSLTSLKDSIYKDTKHAMIQTAERKYRNEYLQSLYDIQELQHQYQTILWILAIVAIIILAGYSFWRFRKRLSDQQKKTNEAMAYVDSMRLGYAEVNSKYKSLKNDYHDQNKSSEEIVRLLEKRMGSLKQLLEIASIYESRPLLFYNKFKEYIKIKPQMDIQWEKDIITITNRFCNNLIEELQTAYPNLTVHELCYCSLICLGFTQQSIRVLYDHTNMNSVYSLRTRIRSKLEINNNSSLDSYFREQLQNRNITAFPIIS